MSGVGFRSQDATITTKLKPCSEHIGSAPTPTAQRHGNLTKRSARTAPRPTNKVPSGLRGSTHGSFLLVRLDRRTRFGARPIVLGCTPQRGHKRFQELIMYTKEGNNLTLFIHHHCGARQRFSSTGGRPDPRHTPVRRLQEGNQHHQERRPHASTPDKVGFILMGVEDVWTLWVKSKTRGKASFLGKLGRSRPAGHVLSCSLFREKGTRGCHASPCQPLYSPTMAGLRSNHG
jgi:hypothetical protein